VLLDTPSTPRHGSHLRPPRALLLPPPRGWPCSGGPLPPTPPPTHHPTHPQALAFIYDKELVQLLFQGAQERYGERQGGYTRIKADPFLRRGDATEMAVIELV
jgi:hypothetical protein